MKGVALVRFCTEMGEFAVPVDKVSGVRAAHGIRALPDAHGAIAGLLHADDRPLPVIAALGGSGEHVLVLRTDGPDAAGREFGLLVREVRGVVRLEASAVFGPPEGQRAGLCSGVVVQEEALVLIVDVAALEHVLSGSTPGSPMASSPGPDSTER